MRELIHNLLQRLGAGRVPPGVQPTVEWQLCGACNYDCSYCIQSKRSRRGAPSLALLQRILSGLCALPGSWELKVSGGEPFANPHFVELVVPTLVEQSSHCLSVLSNFSAPLSSLQRFSEQSGERLRIFSASFHPEFCTLSEFLDKALRFRALRERNNPQSSFVVNVVLSPQSLAEQAGWKARLEAEGFRYYPQLMKVGGELYPYGAQQRALLASLFPPDASPHEANLAPSYKGQRCHAGRWYFVLDQHGQAYRCRPAKRLSDDDPEYSLGAIGEPSFARRRSWLCPFERCPCSVPANRGIVESRGTVSWSAATHPQQGLESSGEVSEARHEPASVAGASDAPAQRCEGLARANECIRSLSGTDLATATNPSNCREDACPSLTFDCKQAGEAMGGGDSGG